MLSKHLPPAGLQFQLLSLSPSPSFFSLEAQRLLRPRGLKAFEAFEAQREIASNAFKAPPPCWPAVSAALRSGALKGIASNVFKAPPSPGLQFQLLSPLPSSSFFSLEAQRLSRLRVLKALGF